MKELILSSAGRRYGLKPSVNALEPRFTTSVHSAIPLPPKVDLTSYCGFPKDQGSLGACTAFAASGMLEFLYRRFKNQSPIFSPLFLYYKERELNGDLGQGDTGSFGSTAVRLRASGMPHRVGRMSVSRLVGPAVRAQYG